jgi:hypothetical protein
VKGIEHLKDGVGHMLFDRDAGAKRLVPGAASKTIAARSSPVRTIVQRRANLAHHRDVSKRSAVDARR